MRTLKRVKCVSKAGKTFWGVYVGEDQNKYFVVPSMLMVPNNENCQPTLQLEMQFRAHNQRVIAWEKTNATVDDYKLNWNHEINVDTLVVYRS